MKHAISRVGLASFSSGNCHCDGAKWKMVACKTEKQDVGDKENNWKDVTQVVMRCLKCGGIHQERLLGKYSSNELETKIL